MAVSKKLANKNNQDDLLLQRHYFVARSLRLAATMGHAEIQKVTPLQAQGFLFF